MALERDTIGPLMTALAALGRRIAAVELRHGRPARPEEILTPDDDPNLAQLERAPIALVMHRGGRVVYLNRAAARLTGNLRGEIIGSPVLRFVEPGSLERVRERLKSLSSDSTEAELAEVALLDRMGRIVHTLGASLALEHEGERFIFTLFTDVTDLRSARAALTESEDRYRMLAQNAQDLVAEIDDRGEVLFLSPSHTDLLGYSEEQLLEAYPLGLTHPEDLPAVERQFERMLEGRPVGRMVHRLRRNDGTYRWFESSARPYRTASGELHVVCIARDVTERQLYAERLQREVISKNDALEKAKAAIRELQGRLIRHERTAAGDDLAGSVAHAIGNPLTALRGTVEMALEAVPERDPTLERIAELARRIQDVVDRTLDLMRDGAVVLEPGSPASLLEQLCEETGPRAAEQSVRLEVKLEPELPLLELDRATLLSALENVAANALDAMPGGGTLSLEAESLPEARAVVLRISDTGPGMERELRDKACRPYFTTKARAPGLGLTIASTIVQAHRGKLRLDPAPGGGTAVSIELPIPE